MDRSRARARIHHKGDWAKRLMCEQLFFLLYFIAYIARIPSGLRIFICINSTSARSPNLRTLSTVNADVRSDSELVWFVQ